MAPSALRAQSKASDTITLRIDPGTSGPRIDRHIFGQFAEHLGSGVYGGIWVGPDSPIPNVRGIRSDVVAALKAIRVPNVRWPGGCFAEEYHWRRGIGPQSKRYNTVNASWGGSGEPNSFGTDEFMDFLAQIGAEAYVSVNVGSGTVEEASDWLAYLTANASTTPGGERAANGHPAPYKIKFLGLGNESWGCGGSMRADHYVDLMKPFARFTRNYNPAQQGEQAMVRVAVGPGDAKTADYTEAVMRAWKDHDWAWNIEALSLHSYTVGGWPPHYPSVGFDTRAYAELVKETLGMDDLISRNAAIMDRYDPEKKVALAVDEWGVWLAPSPGTNPDFLVQQNSLRDAIIASLNLNIFARHADRVRVTNIAQMVNVLQALIMTNQGQMVLTPTYHVYRMYVPFQDATFVPVEFDAGAYANGSITLPRIDAVAARNANGQLWLALTNLDPDRSIRVKVQIGDVGARSLRGETLTGARVDSVNSFATPGEVQPRAVGSTGATSGGTLEIPPRSVTVVAVDP
jgi:alpha-N-arabinofuranosidase